MEGVEKRGLFVFGILVLFIIMFTGFSSAAHICADSQVILKLSGATNAHGEVWNEAGNYDVEICYDTIFGVMGNGDRTCSTGNANKVVGLSGSTNAHAEEPGLNNYATDICYGDLSCTARTGACLTGESLVLSLSSSTNAHLASDSSYSQNICCSIGPLSITHAECVSNTCTEVPGAGDDTCAEIGAGCDPSIDEHAVCNNNVCEVASGPGTNECGVIGGACDVTPGNCTLTSASWSVTEAIEGSLVNLNVVTSGCTDGIIMSFEVWEDDIIGDDPVSTNPSDESISGNSATGTWVAEWQEDASGDPEYYFIATISSTGENMQSSNLLTVIQLPPPYCNPVILCGNYYTLEDITAENACNADPCTVAEFSVETKQGSGFCDDGDITCLCEWNVTGSVCQSAWEELDIPITGECGDGVLDFGEVCDGSLLDGNSCVGFGFSGGDLECNSQCDGFITANCDGYSCNNDGVLDAGSEACDGSDLGGFSCVDFDDFVEGDLLGCNSNCDFDTNLCSTGGGGDGSVIGRCVYTETSTGSCETDGFLSSSWTAVWFGDPSEREASCVGGEKVIECPAQIPLSFFNLYNMLITLLAIAGIYGILSLKKKL